MAVGIIAGIIPRNVSLNVSLNVRLIIRLIIRLSILWAHKLPVVTYSVAHHSLNYMGLQLVSPSTCHLTGTTPVNMILY